MVILPGSAHQLVPKSKVQAIIALKVLVVLVVVHRGIEPLAQPVAVGTLGKKLVAQMAIYIVQGHEYQKHHDVRKMDGNGKGKYIDDARLHHGLGRAKGKGGPRGWVGAFVVQQVKELEELGMVHEAVRNIKIRIVHEQHHGKDEEIVRGTMLAQLCIKSSMRLDNGVVEHQRHQGKNYKRDTGIHHFPPVIAALWPTLLYLFEKGLALVPYIKYQKGQACNEQVPYR